MRSSRILSKNWRPLRDATPMYKNTPYNTGIGIYKIIKTLEVSSKLFRIPCQKALVITKQSLWIHNTSKENSILQVAFRFSKNDYNWACFYSNIILCVELKNLVSTLRFQLFFKEKKIFTLLKSGVINTLSPTVIKIRIWVTRCSLNSQI